MTAQPVTRRAPPRWKRPGLNPILIKEWRSRMRGPRAFLILTGFLLLLSGVAFLLYKTVEESFRYAYGVGGTSAMVGATMFLGLAFFELFLVAFITPALTAGTVSGEQEALTYEMLIATPLRASSILLGKMVAALSYVFLLILAAVPMLSLVYIFGGVTVRDMGIALLILVVTMITFGTVGMFWSALLRRTGRATIMSYVTVLGFILVPYVLAAVWGIMKRQTPPPSLSYLNPFAAMTSVLSLGPDQGMPFSGGGPFYLLFSLLASGMSLGGAPLPYNHPAWHWTLALYALLTLVLGLMTILLLRAPGSRRVTLRQGLGSLLLLLVLLGSYSQLFSSADWQQIMESPDVAWQRQQGGQPGVIEPAIQPAVPILVDPPK